MTLRVHLFPYRTQKLSSVVPKILGNTEVKLSGAENSALATRCENREMPILVASFPLSNEADFCSRLFYFINYTFVSLH